MEVFFSLDPDDVLTGLFVSFAVVAIGWVLPVDSIRTSRRDEGIGAGAAVINRNQNQAFALF